MFICILGAVAALAGFIALGAEISVGSSQCGTVMNHDGDIAGLRQDDTLGSLASGRELDSAGKCTDAINARMVWAIPLAVVGSVALLGGLVVRTRPRSEAS